MNFLSVCSGIEAASAAWHPLGWDAVAFSEIEEFPSAVLAARHPSVPNWGDMTKFEEWPDAIVDVLVGGTPCQSFSVAGLRRGLADPRGNLALTYLAIAERYRPRWLVWENVPGVLSSDDGRAFGALLGGMEKLGYGWAYRTLDAQYFGVAQRRRRVFVVASARGWAAAASVLFEPDSLRGNSAPSREAGQGSARGFECGPQGSGFVDVVPTLDTGCKDGPIRNQLGAGVIQFGPDVSPALKARDSKGPSPIIGFNGRQDAVPGSTVGAIDTDPHTQCVAFSCKDYGADAGDTAPTLRAMGHDGTHANAGGQLAVAFHENQRAEVSTNDTAGAINSGGGKPGQGYPAVMQGMSVRRLTPTECERLQGFPDDYTAISYRGKPAADGPRYKALGNSMAVPVMRWIGDRIEAVDVIATEVA